LRSIISRAGGGKSQLRSEIVTHFPENFKAYVEPFAGAMWVLLGEERPGIVEVANDCDGRLMNFWSVVKNEPERLCDLIFEKEVKNRDQFVSAVAGTFDEAADGVERAALYFNILRNSYISQGQYFCKPRSEDFSDTVKKSIKKRVNEASERLRDVELKRSDFESVMRECDGADTFFYLDPPYYRCAKKMRHGFSFGDFERLFGVLGEIKGKFLMSFDDCGFVRHRLKGSGFEISEIERANNFTNKRDEKRGLPYYELLVKNY
jgi:DNA adenine methylase